MGGVARAGGQANTIGIGVEEAIPGIQDVGMGRALLLAGTVGSINYDAGKFHAGGFLGFDDPSGAFNTFFTFGGRFFYHVHSTAMADFSVGGQIGIAYVPTGNMGPGADHYDTEVFLEPGVQIRAFLASNVALSFSLGIVIGAADASGVQVGGQVQGSAGIHYYFF
jgi:hypothetical protein